MRSLRQSGKGTPVLFLTARDAISDRVKGLDSGANDYLVKPFSFEELTARLRAMTRGRFGMVSNVITVPLAVLLPHWRSLERERPMELIRRRHLSPRRSLSVKTVSMCMRWNLPLTVSRMIIRSKLRTELSSQKNTEGQLTGTIQQTDPVTALPVVDSPVVVITAERAKEIALQQASLAATNVTFVHAELDYDDGVQVYDVESYQGNTEYDYEIDAATGTILSCNYDAEAHQPAAQQNDPAATPSSTVQTPIAPNNAAYIGVDCAKNIAVSHAGIALADAAFQKAKLENDDGRAEYEIEFYKDGIEYEYTIDAVSGTVLEYYVERDD